jgi:probable F420-dependent oxidoreductase
MISIGWFGVGSGALADAEGVAEVATAAETLGFESIWVGEHPVLIDPHAPPSPLPPRSEMLDPIPVLAYAAARTTSIKLGTGIVILPLRNPVILAKQLASVDVLSKGRLLVGVGVGYVPGEYEAIGVPFERRGQRADDYIDAMRALWDQDEPEFSGEFAAFSGIQSRPQPLAPRLPVHASGMSTVALRRAVSRADGWYGFFQDLDATRRSLAELDRLAGEVERPASLGPLQITITPPPGPLDVDTVNRFEDLGVHRLVILRDFMDMAGGPVPATRGLFVQEMEATAARLGLGGAPKG